MKKAKAISDIVFSTLICAIVIVIGAAIFILPKKEISQKENRALAPTPELSLKAVVSGRFFEQLSAFYSDHVPLRDEFTALHALGELSLCRIETGGVISADGVLIPVERDNKDGQIPERLYGFTQSRNETYLYAVPRPIDVFAESLPEVFDKETLNASIKGDALEDFNELKENGAALYYKTDHHWNTDGAYFAYRQICERMGITPFEKEHFKIETVSESFYGTSFSKSGLPRFLVAPDSIRLYRYADDEDFTVTNKETGESKKGFYRSEFLDRTDKYAVFLGGNYAHLTLKADTQQSREKLLLIKDSYANCVIPFLALHFDMEIIDPRYCTPSYLDEQIKKADTDKILILMGLDTLKE